MNSASPRETKSSKFVLFGWVVFPFTTLFALRLAYEELYLTLTQGPQMIFFSWSHTKVGLVLLMYASTFAAVLFLLCAVVRAIWRVFRRKPFARMELLQILVITVLLVMITMPSGWWVRPRMAIGGVGYNNYHDFAIAAWYGDMSVVKTYLSHGAPIDGQTVKGNTPLNSACAGKRLEVANFLLSKGADYSLAPECRWVNGINGHKAMPQVPGTTIEVN